MQRPWGASVLNMLREGKGAVVQGCEWGWGGNGESDVQFEGRSQGTDHSGLAGCSEQFAFDPKCPRKPLEGRQPGSDTT